MKKIAMLSLLAFIMVVPCFSQNPYAFKKGDTIVCTYGAGLYSKNPYVHVPASEFLIYEKDSAGSAIVIYKNHRGEMSYTALISKKRAMLFMPQLKQKRINDSLDVIKARQQEKDEELAKIKYKNGLIKKYGTTIATKILANKIWIGMTDKMARESWGEPDDINRTVGSWGTHEQWVYDSQDTYLYFENGILTSWQD